MNWTGICFASYFTYVLYLLSQWVIKGITVCIRSAGLMIILCTARKIKAMTCAKVKGNRIFQKICNVIRVLDSYH